MAFATALEQLGFWSVFVTEHHFTDYALTPAPFQLLSFIASRTDRIKLGTGVVVLPWHDPIRLAEEVLMLDALSSSRVIVGVGRGASRSEYEGLGIPLEESELRFTVNLRKLISELRWVAEEGPGSSVRPRLEGRSVPVYTASAGGVCGDAAAQLGLGQLLPGQSSPATLSRSSESYRKMVLGAGCRYTPPIVLMLCVCRESDTQAVELAAEYFDADWPLVDSLYRFSDGGLSSIAGYSSYRETEAHFRRLFADSEYRASSNQELIKTQVVGSPQACFECLKGVQDYSGSDHIVVEFGFGHMPLLEARRSMELFAHEVLPRLA